MNLLRNLLCNLNPSVAPLCPFQSTCRSMCTAALPSPLALRAEAGLPLISSEQIIKEVTALAEQYPAEMPPLPLRDADIDYLRALPDATRRVKHLWFLRKRQQNIEAGAQRAELRRAAREETAAASERSDDAPDGLRLRNRAYAAMNKQRLNKFDNLRLVQETLFERRCVILDAHYLDEMTFTEWRMIHLELKHMFAHNRSARHPSHFVIADLPDDAVRHPFWAPLERELFETERTSLHYTATPQPLSNDADWIDRVALLSSWEGSLSETPPTEDLNRRPAAFQTPAQRFRNRVVARTEDFVYDLRDLARRLSRGGDAAAEAPLRRPKRLVYLSPDATKPINVLRPCHETYIVGLLVDGAESRDGRSAARARQLGIEARRLPFKEMLPRSSSIAGNPHRLCIDACVRLLRRGLEPANAGRRLTSLIDEVLQLDEEKFVRLIGSGAKKRAMAAKRAKFLQKKLA